LRILSSQPTGPARRTPEGYKLTTPSFPPSLPPSFHTTTAASVLELFPDLELAIEDDEPALAHEFFETVKKWVGELRRRVAEAQHRNQESMFKLHKILVKDEEGEEEEGGEEDEEGGREGGREEMYRGGARIESVSSRLSSVAGMKVGGEGGWEGSSSSATQRAQQQQEEEKRRRASSSSSTAASQQLQQQQKRVSRIRSRDDRDRDTHPPRQQPPSPKQGGREGGKVTQRADSTCSSSSSLSSSSSSSSSSAAAKRQEEAGLMSFDPELYQAVKKLKEAKENDVKLSETQLLDLFFSVNGNNPLPEQQQQQQGKGGIGEEGREGGVRADPVGRGNSVDGGGGGREGGRDAAADPLAMEESSLDRPLSQMFTTMAIDHSPSLPPSLPFLPPSRPSSPSPKSRELTLVLAKLRDVDQILEHLAVFWAQTEVILEVLLQKSEHVERFVSYSHKPRLKDRFVERLAEYRMFWVGVQGMCHQFTAAVSAAPAAAGGTAAGAAGTAGFPSAAAMMGGGEGGGGGGGGGMWGGVMPSFAFSTTPSSSLPSAVAQQEGGVGGGREGGVVGGGVGGGQQAPMYRFLEKR